MALFGKKKEEEKKAPACACNSGCASCHTLYENVNVCACPKKTCPNNGKCCACVIKHRETDSLPYCLFPDNNGDKSNRNHYEVLKKRFER